MEIDLARQLIVGLAGLLPTRRELAWLQFYRPAGVILFNRNISNYNQLSRLCTELHGRLGPGAEIVADHEGGAVSVLSAAVGRPPSPFGLGRCGDPELTRRVHGATGRRLASVGIDRVLAPCCDVLVEERNPVIGARAFGATEDLVAAQVSAAVAGLRQGGVACCLKHWPGHGGTTTDSHEGAVKTAAGAVAGPFLAGWRTGADALMIGHLPAEDAPAAALPATLDEDLLATARASAPPGTLLYSDDVSMGALRDSMARLGVTVAGEQTQGLIDPAILPRAWFRCLLEAGCDRLLVRAIPWQAFPLADDDSAVDAHGEDGSSPGERAAPEAASAAALAAASREPLFDAEPYVQARRAIVPANWNWGAGGSLVWIDATAGDRWGAADDLESLLSARFSAVVRIVLAEAEGLPPQAAAAASLLITAHRPLPRSFLGRIWSVADRPASGACVVLGHPSLAAQLSADLGPGWRLAAAYDVTAADLLELVD